MVVVVVVVMVVVMVIKGGVEGELDHHAHGNQRPQWRGNSPSLYLAIVPHIVVLCGEKRGVTPS